jgi:tRNA (cytidine/uridine-2'-O-)-methyltransferase
MPFTIVLLEPQIPPNTGNIARLCAATGTTLHIVGKLGFELSDKTLKRAGLDYWKHVNWIYFENLEQYIANLPIENCHFLTTKTDTVYFKVDYNPDDYLIFGSETTGINEAILKAHWHRTRTIPMQNKSEGIRSINLSTAVGIVLFEAIRQQTV